MNTLQNLPCQTIILPILFMQLQKSIEKIFKVLSFWIKLILFYNLEINPSVYFIIVMINMNELYLEVKNKWKSLYPIYFDQSKTIQEGRRLPKQLCIKDPTLEQVAKAVCMCQLRNIIQPHKSYSRDYFQMGRLKVQLLLQNGKPVHNVIPNKKQLLKYVAKYLRELRNK